RRRRAHQPAQVRNRARRARRLGRRTQAPRRGLEGAKGRRQTGEANEIPRAAALARHDLLRGRELPGPRRGNVEGLRPTAAARSARTRTKALVLHQGGALGDRSDAKVSISKYSKKMDWEAELAVVIGRKARDLTLDNALSCVAGYTVGNDLSARDLG